jgi:hypothetical protein
LPVPTLRKILASTPGSGLPCFSTTRDGNSATPHPGRNMISPIKTNGNPKVVKPSMILLGKIQHISEEIMLM